MEETYHESSASVTLLFDTIFVVRRKTFSNRNSPMYYPGPKSSGRGPKISFRSRFPYVGISYQNLTVSGILSRSEPFFFFFFR